MNRTEVRALIDKRVKLAEDAKALIPKAGEKWIPENRTKYDQIFKDIDALKVQIDDQQREDRSAELETELSERRNLPEGQPGSDREERIARNERGFGEPSYSKLFEREFKSLTPAQQHRRAFMDYVLNGRGGMDAETRQFLANKRVGGKEARDMGISTSGAGGVFVPQGYVYDIFEAQKFYGKLIDHSNVIDTGTGNPMPWPNDNDVANAAHVIGEGTQVNEQDVSLSSITLKAWMYTTDAVKVSLQLLQDSAFDMESYLKKKFAIRFGRGLNTDITLGSGVNKPNGVVTAVVASNPAPAAGWTGYGIPVIAAGSSSNTGGAETGTTSIGSQDLDDLIGSVDPAYRQGAELMIHDSTRRFLARLLDKYGRPLWRPGMAVKEPDTINDYPYFLNNDLDTIGASKNTVFFGNFREAFVVRRVKELAVLRLDERFADYGQVAFLAFARFDSQLIDPGNHPINYLQQHS